MAAVAEKSPVCLKCQDGTMIDVTDIVEYSEVLTSYVDYDDDKNIVDVDICNDHEIINNAVHTYRLLGSLLKAKPTLTTLNNLEITDRSFEDIVDVYDTLKDSVSVSRKEHKKLSVDNEVYDWLCPISITNLYEVFDWLETVPFDKLTGDVEVYKRTIMHVFQNCQSPLVCKWLYTFRHYVADDRKFTENLFQAVARYNSPTRKLKTSYDLATWLYSLGDVSISNVGYLSFQNACSSGQKDLAEWIYSLNPITHSSVLYNAFAGICKTSNIEMGKWISTLKLFPATKIKTQLLHVACKSGNLELVEWMYSFDGDLTPEYMTRMFQMACVSGNSELVLWVHSLGEINIREDEDKAFKTVCKNGNLELAQWIYSTAEASGHKIELDKPIVGKAYESGNIALVHWITSLLSDTTLLEHMRSHACLSGNLELVQMVHSTHPFDAEKLYYYSPVYNSIKSNNLEVVQYIYSLSEKYFNCLKANGYLYFEAACRNGNLEMAQWLHSVCEVNIHSPPGSPREGKHPLFEVVCNSGNIDLVEWVYSMGDTPDVFTTPHLPVKSDYTHLDTGSLIKLYHIITTTRKT